MLKIKKKQKVNRYAGEPALRKLAMRYRDKVFYLEKLLRRTLPFLSYADASLSGRLVVFCCNVRVVQKLLKEIEDELNKDNV